MIIFGWLADRVSARFVVLMSILLQGRAVALLLAWASPLAAALFGAGMGGQYCGRPLLTADLFEVQEYGTLWGPSSLFTLPAVAGSQWLAASLFDHTGSDSADYSISIALWLAGALAVVAPGSGHRRGRVVAQAQEEPRRRCIGGSHWSHSRRKPRRACPPR
jgi:MFS family permease